MDETELVVVGTFPNRIEAEMAQGALESGGIASVITADDVGGQYASISLTGAGVRLHERPEDVEAAQELLSQAR
jgi:hypothetical protein